MHRHAVVRLVGGKYESVKRNDSTNGHDVFLYRFSTGSAANEFDRT